MAGLAQSPPRFGPGFSLRIAAYFTFAIVLFPLIAVIWVSFFENKIIGFPPTGYTLKWYFNAWSLGRFHRGFVLSVEVGLMATAASLLLGVPAAIALARKEFAGREVVHSLLMSPLVVPGIVSGAAIYMFYIETEAFLDERMHVSLPLAGSLFGLSVAHTLLALPWMVRLVTASLIGMDIQLEEAVSMADRIVVMNGGRIEQAGTPQEVYEKPATRFVAEFVGLSNLIPGTVEGAGRFRTSQGTVLQFCDDGVVSSRGHLVVRPEKIEIGGQAEGHLNSLSGEIDSIVFLGPLTEICVRLPGGERITAHRQNRRTGGAQALRLGQKTTVAWAPESGFVLADG